jgi:uncharacterized protein (TIGR02453 family)
MSTYFNQEFIDFFKELTVNNHKDWFDANRKRYLKFVKEPFYDLVADLITEAKKIDSSINIPVKNAVFRINRDVRFSKDKSPYNLHLSAIISGGGRKNMQIPGFFCRFSIGECSFGGGHYMPDKENLMAIRKKIANDPKAFEKLLKEKSFVKVFGGLSESEKNKILPKELKPYGQDLPILFNKQFFYMKDYDGEEILLRDDLLHFVMDHFKAGEGMNRFLTS